MRILHLASEYPPQQVFGLGRFVCDLAEEQVRQGHAVTVITNSVGSETSAVKQRGVQVLRVEYPPPPKPVSTSGCVMVFNTLLLARAASLGRRSLRSFDVVCSHDWLTAPASQALHNELGVPHICTFHDTVAGKSLGQKDDGDKFAVQVERWTVQNATHIIANSNATKKELVEVYNTDPSKVSVVPCAVAPSSFEVASDQVRVSAFRQAIAESDELIVLYVGRLDPEKGIDTLLEAFEAARIDGARLCLAGRGKLLGDLREKAKHLGLEGRVAFLGYVENPVLAHLYHCSDMLVCPSLYEPFGMVVPEAMLQGVPVIASSVGGLEEQIEEGRTGLLVPSGNVPALATAIRRLAENPVLRKALGTAARDVVLHHRTWTPVCKQTLDVYRHCSNRGKSRSAKRTNRLFVAGDLVEGMPCESRVTARRLAQETAEEGTCTIVIANNNQAFPQEDVSASDRRIINAFLMASALLDYVSKPLKELVCYHWDAMLAARVLANTGNRILYYSPEIPKKLENQGDGQTFEFEMLIWAAGKAHEVRVPNATSAEALRARGLGERTLVSPEGALPRSAVVDAEIFRSTFAGSDEYLSVSMLRLDPPFSPKAFVNTVETLQGYGLHIRWLLCGEGGLLPDLKTYVSQRRLPVNFTGDLPDRILDAILIVADVALVPLKGPTSSRFVDKALSYSKPVLAPLGTSQTIGTSTSLLLEVDFDSADALARAITTALGSGSVKDKIVEKHNCVERPKWVRCSKNPRDVVLYNNWGMGDELLLSAVAREVKREFPDKRVWVRSRFGFKFPKFCEPFPPPSTAAVVETTYQNTVVFGPQYNSPFPGHLVEQMLAKLSIDTGIDVVAKDVRPEVRTGSSAVLRDHNKVVLHSGPNQRFPTKDWGLSKWERLCKLLDKQGKKLVQVGAQNEPLLPHVEDLRARPVCEVTDVVAGVGLVICPVGFLMHVAAATHTPAIVIYGGREHPEIAGYPGHFHLCSDNLACRGRWGCYIPPDRPCPHQMRCMEDITPEMVSDLVQMMQTAERERAML